MSEQQSPGPVQSGGGKFIVQVSNYGRYEFVAESREQAEQMAEAKRRWERALNKLVWRADLATDFDRLTEEVADAFYRGKGVDRALLEARALARRALTTPSETPCV